MSLDIRYVVAFVDPEGGFNILDSFPGLVDIGDDDQACLDEAMRVVARLRNLADRLEISALEGYGNKKGDTRGSDSAQGEVPEDRH